MRYKFDTANALSDEQWRALQIEPRPEFALDMALLGIALYIIASVAVIIWGPTLLVIAALPVFTLAAGSWTLFSWNSKRWSEHCYLLLESGQETVDSLEQKREPVQSEWSMAPGIQNSKYAGFVMTGCLVFLLSIEAMAFVLFTLGLWLQMSAEYGRFWGGALALGGLVAYIYVGWEVLGYTIDSARMTTRSAIDWARHKPFNP